jgi:hypothetical protein
MDEGLAAAAGLLMLSKSTAMRLVELFSLFGGASRVA